MGGALPTLDESTVVTDFVVVGGGVYGCAVSWHLARAGASVALLEASVVGSGASGGLGERGVRGNGRDPRELPLIRRAHEIWPELADQLGGPTGFRRTGHLLMAEREEDFRRLDVQCRLQIARGLPSRVLSGSEVRDVEPETHQRVTRALLCEPDGVADHTTATRTWAQAGVREGVVLRENARVEKLWQEGGTVKGVRTAQGETFSAQRGVLLLGNVSVPELVEEAFGTVLPLWPVVPQVVVTEPSHEPVVRHLIGHAHRRLAVKGLPDGRVMLSGGWRGQWDPERGQGEVIGSAVEGNLTEAATVFPKFGELAVETAVSDRPETMCIDGVPIIDKCDSSVPVWFGAGWTGHGWAIAPAVSEAMADWVLSGTRPAVLAPFCAGRI